MALDNHRHRKRKLRAIVRRESVDGNASSSSSRKRIWAIESENGKWTFAHLTIILLASCSAFRQIGYEKIGRFQVFLASCLTSISFYKPFDIFNEVKSTIKRSRIFAENCQLCTTTRNHKKWRVQTYARVADGNASAVDSAFDGDGGDGGAAPSSNPWCGCCADDAASSPDADDTGRDDADADDTRAAERSLSTGKPRGCGRPSCRVLLSSNRYRRSIKKPGWRDELGLSLAFSKRFASSLPPEDVLDSTSLTPLSAGLAGSDPLPASGRRRHETKEGDASSYSRNLINVFECFTWRTRGGSSVRRLAHLSVTGQVSAISVLQPQTVLLGMLGEDAMEQTGATGGSRTVIFCDLSQLLYQLELRADTEATWLPVVPFNIDMLNTKRRRDPHSNRLPLPQQCLARQLIINAPLVGDIDRSTGCPYRATIAPLIRRFANNDRDTRLCEIDRIIERIEAEEPTINFILNLKH
ncbi:hypothetical protein EAG_01745 [Camponotus floridanus]|uniref:Uncharacterized protein n=1 Tax=Camponotus floridanus TaxID=104421 RepID=E2AX42_CAMFO|nr:hypothetical protein EAG_01745 [Camponotus floridanus]